MLGLKVRQLKNFLPAWLIQVILRRRMRIPWEENPRYEIKVAETLDEYIGALSLLYRSYLRLNYTKKMKNKIRITPYHLLPSTIVLVVKDTAVNSVVGTISIIQRGELGLPLEESFKLKNPLPNHRKVGEISGLAVDKSYRDSMGAISIPLIKYMTNLMLERLNMDEFFVVTNPRTRHLYEGIWSFMELKDVEPVKKHDFANGQEGILLYSNRQRLVNFIRDKFPKKMERNLYRYLFNHKLYGAIYPKMEFEGQHGYGVPLKVMEMFFSEFEGRKIEVSELQKKKIKNIVSNTHLSLKSYLMFGDQFKNRSAKRFRYISQAWLIVDDYTEPSRIINVTSIDISKNMIRIYTREDLSKVEFHYIKLATMKDNEYCVERVELRKRRGENEYILEVMSASAKWIDVIRRLHQIDSDSGLRKVS
ncbi:MAG: hypothetical protein CL674_04115 [Bdellovibrionaceae bacterium]|nr:hypothetical protein [Pseudobdellovibrionaceae bacterium]